MIQKIMGQTSNTRGNVSIALIPKRYIYNAFIVKTNIKLVMKVLRIFTLFHSDVKDPTRIPYITSSKWFVSFIDDHT